MYFTPSSFHYYGSCLQHIQLKQNYTHRASGFRTETSILTANTQYSHKSQLLGGNKTGQVKRLENTYSIRSYCRRTPFSCAGFSAIRKKIRKIRAGVGGFLRSDCVQAMHVLESFYRRVYRGFYAVNTELWPQLRRAFYNFCWKSATEIWR